MKLANKIKISVFCKPEDDEASVKEKFLSLFPFNLVEEKIYLKQSSAKSFTNRVIKVFEVELDKNKHLNLFLRNLNTKLNQIQKEMLLSQVNSRLDEQLSFFIRLDKEKLLKGEYYITDSGECFHIKISIAAFPAKKERAVDVIREIFSQQSAFKVC